MPEVRFEAKTDTVSVIDAFSQASGSCRTAVINSILDQWAAEKLHESIMVCRVVRVNPLAPESDRHLPGAGS